MKFVQWLKKEDDIFGNKGTAVFVFSLMTLILFVIIIVSQIGG